MQPELDPQLVDLRDVFNLLRRRRLSIVLVTFVVTVLAVGFVAWRTPVYTSVALVEVRPLTIDEQFQQVAVDSFANMETEAERVTQEPVARLAAPALGLNPGSSDDLADAAAAVDVTVQANTTFLQISCVANGPARAQQMRQLLSRPPTSETGSRTRGSSMRRGSKPSRRRSSRRTNGWSD